MRDVSKPANLMWLKVFVPSDGFYMSDTGTMALTLTVAVVAFMTDSLGGGVGIFVLPIIGALLVATVAPAGKSCTANPGLKPRRADWPGDHSVACKSVSAARR